MVHHRLQFAVAAASLSNPTPHSDPSSFTARPAQGVFLILSTFCQTALTDKSGFFRYHNECVIPHRSN
jgi:hypothetical protein